MSRIIFKEDIKFRCECGGCLEEIGASEFDFEIVEKDEREMGPEIHYSAKLERVCPNCDEMFSIEIEIWEYPMGALNHVEVTATNGKILNKDQEKIFSIQID